MAKFHQPVLLQEVLTYLQVGKGEKYIDATVGGGGHAEAILKLGGRILGLDTDPEAIKAAGERLSSACPTPLKRGLDSPWQLAQVNFVHLKKIARKYNFAPVAGVLFDLGVSSYQLETGARGFSFKQEGFLDMRMDPSLTVTAADLLNGLGSKELAELFFKLGDETDSRSIARAIIRTRKRKPISSTKQLAQIVAQAKRSSRWERIHPATKVFQALRIAVNDELNNLKEALPQAWEILKPKGRLLVISFHSGEDRIVKRFWASHAGAGKVLTQKPVCAGQEEVKKNPRSRSAKLRVMEKNV